MRELAEVATRICELLPKGFQFPNGTWVKLEIRGRQFYSRNFQLSEYSSSRNIHARGKVVGEISVHVNPVLDRYHKVAILPTESMLLETVALLIGKMLEECDSDVHP